MTDPREAPEDPSAQPLHDEAERDAARRKESGREDDPREGQEPPQPFSGSEH